MLLQQPLELYQVQLYKVNMEAKFVHYRPLMRKVLLITPLVRAALLVDWYS